MAVSTKLVAQNEEKEPPKETKQKSSFVIAPAVASSPGFGNGFGAVGLYFFKPNAQDEISPPSTITAVGMYSDTDSYFAGTFGRFHLKEDHWRLIAGVPSGRVNSSLDLNGPENARFENNFIAVFLEAQRKIFGNWFGGIRFISIDQSYRAKNDAGSQYLDFYDVQDTHNGKVSGVISYDSRDNQRYPESGTYGEGVLTYAPDNWSESGEYYVAEVSAASFFKIINDQIFALQFKGITVPDDAPYFERPTLGSRGDLRGYTPGEYVGDHMVLLQLEYRMRFTQRYGGVVFGGGAGLWDDTFTSDDLYWNYGAGIRIRLQEENRVNFRIDYAIGENDQDGWYVSVSEAF
ncbi:BamA/TamA family outer membrane protein [Kiritimatiellaeota bacterium B1221]|nr:BamA/TamA family outer membrane protein [Kiritimatiellaeota bacterium B1221]